jgi:hypothetical protein
MGLLDSIVGFFKPEAEQPRVELGRNETCWCGSGKKYKKCCLERDEEKFRKNSRANCGTR